MSTVLVVRAASLLLERGIHNVRNNVVLWSEAVPEPDIRGIELLIFDARDADDKLSSLVSHFSGFVDRVPAHFWVLCQERHEPVFMQTAFTTRRTIVRVDEQRAAEKIFKDTNHFVVRV